MFEGQLDGVVAQLVERLVRNDLRPFALSWTPLGPTRPNSSLTSISDELRVDTVGLIWPRIFSEVVKRVVKQNYN